MKTLWLFLGLAALALPSHAADRPALVGVWKLLSYQTEFLDGSLRIVRCSASIQGGTSSLQARVD
jgi:hypothetical protein